MKTITLILLSCACFAADEPAKTEKPKPITEFPEEATEGELPGGWGNRFNAKRTGKYEIEGDALKLTAASASEINPGSSFNAPSALVEVDGNFVAEVALDSLPTDHSGWVGGGLFIFINDKQVARLNHAHHKPKKDEPYDEVLDWIHSDSAGKLQSINLSAIKYDVAKPRFFRIERRGNRLHGAFSNDGATWTELYPFNIRHWPAKLKVGPFVLNHSSSPKTLRFTAFKVTSKAQ